jgi:hypothetical protein
MAVSRDDPRLQNAGFARLVGTNVDYTVRKYSVVLGRPNKTLPVDVILTSAMSVSRQHARIYYNFETRESPPFPPFNPTFQASFCPPPPVATAHPSLPPFSAFLQTDLSWR